MLLTVINFGPPAIARIPIGPLQNLGLAFVASAEAGSHAYDFSHMLG